MSCTRIFKRMVATGLGYAAGGAITGSVGAAVLDTAGYAGYSALEACRAGAAGGSLVGGVVGGIKGFFCGDDTSSDDSNSLKEMIGEVVLNAAVSSLSGTLGKLMLNTIIEMPLDKVAAALAVGTGTMAGAAATAGVLIVGGIIVYGCFNAAAKEAAPTAGPRV